MDNMKNHREQIDSIDRKIINLLAQRMGHVKAIGNTKNDRGIDPLDKIRWQEVLKDRIILGERLGLSQTLITQIWNSIHKYSLEIEENDE